MVVFIFCIFGTLVSWLQAPIQAFLRPALWFPGLRAIHRKREIWTILQHPQDVFDKLVQTLVCMSELDIELRRAQRIHISKVKEDRMFIQVYFLTRCCQWLDVVEIEVQPGQFKGALVKAHSFSTGVLPICIPFTFILNMALFFFPFYDWGQNQKRLDIIRSLSELPVEEVEKLSNC